MQVMAIFQEGSTGQVLASTYPSVAGVHYLLVRDDRCVVVVGCTPKVEGQMPSSWSHLPYVRETQPLRQDVQK